MKKLVIALTSVFAVGIIANSYAVNQYPEVNMSEKCREQGITYSTSKSNDKYTTTVSVPEKNSSNINVQVTESSGQTRGYDTRTNNVKKSGTYTNSNGNKYSEYDYGSGENAKVNINCY